MANGDHDSHWPLWRILSYAVGHVLNDMCASTWFSYLLVFLHQVAGLSASEAALVMLSGQIADGIATPLSGVFSDSFKGSGTTSHHHLGPRTGLLAVGALSVVVCYYLVFGFNLLRLIHPPPYIPSSSQLVLYYSIFAALFNVGWATVQVAHMALVPELSRNDHIRCMLNSYRYAFTILSNVLVFVMFYVLLKLLSPVNVPDQHKFTYLATLIVIIGSVAVLVFLVGTPEPRCHEEEEDGQEESTTLLTAQSNKSSRCVVMQWYDWFKVVAFYQVGLVYMCTRLVINITQVYLPFYLMLTMHMNATSIAIVPLVVYLAGFITTFGMRRLNATVGRNVSFVIGGIIDLLALLLLYVVAPADHVAVYFISAILGAGNSIVMVTSICMEGDLVGHTKGGSAFVYGAMSFTDKISNGIAVLVIQNARQAVQEQFGCRGEEDGIFIRKAFCIVPAVSVVVAIITVLYMMYSASKNNVGQRNNSNTITACGIRSPVINSYGTTNDEEEEECC